MTSQKTDSSFLGMTSGLLSRLKSVAGMVLAGEIQSVGEKVKRFKKGDQVYGMINYGFGTYAEANDLLFTQFTPSQIERLAEFGTTPFPFPILLL